MLTATPFSIDTFAVMIAGEWTFGIASGSAVVGSLDRNAHIADVTQPETINFKGVFRVTRQQGAFQMPKVVRKPKKKDDPAIRHLSCKINYRDVSGEL
jgi:hypothetical protein